MFALRLLLYCSILTALSLLLACSKKRVHDARRLPGVFARHSRSQLYYSVFAALSLLLACSRRVDDARRPPGVLARSATACRVNASMITAACIRQHTSAYVSIRQHMSAYVSIRQHTCWLGLLYSSTACGALSVVTCLLRLC